MLLCWWLPLKVMYVVVFRTQETLEEGNIKYFHLMFFLDYGLIN